MLCRAQSSGDGVWTADVPHGKRESAEPGSVSVAAHVQLQPAMAFQGCRVVFEHNVIIQEGDCLSVQGRDVPLVPHAVHGTVALPGGETEEGGATTVQFTPAADIKASTLKRHWLLHQELWGQAWTLHSHRVLSMRVSQGKLHLGLDEHGPPLTNGDESSLWCGAIPSLAAFAALLSKLSPVFIPSTLVVKGVKIRANKKLLKRMGFGSSASSKKDIDLGRKGQFELEPFAVVPFNSVHPRSIGGVCAALSDVFNSHRVPSQILVNGAVVPADNVDSVVAAGPTVYVVNFSEATWFARFLGPYPEREIEVTGSDLLDAARKVEVAPFACDESFTVDAPDGRVRIRPSMRGAAMHVRIAGPFGGEVAGFPEEGIFVGGFLATRCPVDAVPEAPLMSHVSLTIGGYKAQEALVSIPCVSAPTTWSVSLGTVQLEERISLSDIEVRFEEEGRVPPRAAVYIEVRQRTRKRSGPVGRRGKRGRSIVDVGAEGILVDADE